MVMEDISGSSRSSLLAERMLFREDWLVLGFTLRGAGRGLGLFDTGDWSWVVVVVVVVVAVVLSAVKTSSLLLAFSSDSDPSLFSVSSLTLCLFSARVVKDVILDCCST